MLQGRGTVLHQRRHVSRAQPVVNGRADGGAAEAVTADCASAGAAGQASCGCDTRHPTAPCCTAPRGTAPRRSARRRTFRAPRSHPRALPRQTTSPSSCRASRWSTIVYFQRARAPPRTALQLSQPLFSTPVAVPLAPFGARVVLGCRDDHLYGLRLSVDELE